jgi:RNA recognition motif-containing protein
MSKKLFIGNLGFSTGESELRAAFEAMGNVVSAAVVMDRATGQSRGFGFVEYGSVAEAEKAMQSLDGTLLDGRPIRVNVAHDRQPR